MEDDIGVEVIHGITVEGSVLMSVRVNCGGDIIFASEVAEMLEGIIKSAFEVALSTKEETQ